MEHHSDESRNVYAAAHTPEPRHGEEQPYAPEGTDTTQAFSGPLPRSEPEAFTDVQRFHDRWNRIQKSFVDDPRASVAAADSLVGEAIEQFTARLNERRRRIESSWQRRSEGGSDTERLRVALREYRTLLDQLTMVPY
ncbi:hypothetical protein JCM3263A_25210 [Thermobifida fusca]|uniref:Uncharacterized protein n=2 Tax=Thermobifida fusca TaxID=2021 RepID=A0A9P2TAW0_THEFU|nr:MULTISPECIES: hypothetical protein [Thermobifida]AAZ55402.1 conserved hypothetical protein [Thermobifida fusca YX]EOR71533.1 hypothetical protein TM51_07186 [Thermobifida fusca TM51]MBO2528564.1 hypothetical protein [Thermobifida sp.]MDD6790901.1 hypothetical protein [Thermobifida fusca]PPS92056.1 hypothetical protein BH05_11810 [Thermobifida fusca]